MLGFFTAAGIVQHLLLYVRTGGCLTRLMMQTVTLSWSRDEAVTLLLHIVFSSHRISSHCVLPRQVIPPGMDFSSVVVPEVATDEDEGSGSAHGSAAEEPPIWAQVRSRL